MLILSSVFSFFLPLLSTNCWPTVFGSGRRKEEIQVTFRHAFIWNFNRVNVILSRSLPLLFSFFSFIGRLGCWRPIGPTAVSQQPHQRPMLEEKKRWRNKGETVDNFPRIKRCLKNRETWRIFLWEVRSQRSPEIYFWWSIFSLANGQTRPWEEKEREGKVLRVLPSGRCLTAGVRVGESLRIGMLSSPSTSGKTYEDPCPIQTRRDKRIESESHAWARIGKNIGSSLLSSSSNSLPNLGSISCGREEPR